VASFSTNDTLYSSIWQCSSSHLLLGKCSVMNDSGGGAAISRDAARAVGVVAHSNVVLTVDHAAI
jgi:hypothetical protein